MTPALRTFTITAHVAFSVGWLGAVAAFLVLSIAGLTSHDAEVVRGAYLSMDLISRFVIIPMCFAALVTGLLQALGTPWGLFRYYWILMKFGLAVVATIALLVHQFVVVAEAAKRVSGAAAETLFSADLGPLKTELVRAPSLSILFLLVAATLGVYKPWGLTRYGRRKQQERSKVQQQPSNETPFGVKISFAVIAMLVLVFVVLHLTGHGFERHGH
jgi:MFS family permease